MMEPVRRVPKHLLLAWLASLDCDPETWHESPWAHIVFLIGQGLKEHEPEALRAALDEKLSA